MLSNKIKKRVKKNSFWRQNFFLFREFKSFKRIAILAISFTLLAAVFEGFGVGFILTFLQSFTDPNAEPIHTGIDWFDRIFLAVYASPSERLYRISALILIITWVRCGFTFLGELYAKSAQTALVDGIRKRLFDQLQSLRLSYFSSTRSGELINSLTTETKQLERSFETVAMLISRGSILLVYGISIILISWQLTLISLILFSLLTVGLSTLIKKVRTESFERSKANGEFTTTAVEFISGIRTVQAFSTQEFERQRFYAASNKIVESTQKIISFGALVVPLSEGIAISILLGILVFAYSVYIPSGQLEPAALLTFLFVLFRLMPIVRQVNGSRVKLSEYHGSLVNIRELCKTENKPYMSNGYISFSGLNNSIEFVSVDFAYDMESIILKDINLTISEGQTTAFVGASGAGKTTLADLIPRFYDPVAGKILLDGIDLQKYDVNSVRQKMAIVSQDTFIFNASVKDNICYGSPNVDYSEIERVARLANAMGFIEAMPDGFDTQLGDRGVRLSGGQRQRIAIARALIRNPEILILDEATSALDSVSEKLIQESIERLSAGRTVIAIAHRLSTIAGADKVVVLEKGRIVEQGTYAQLLEHRGKLWAYHQMQNEPSHMIEA